MRDAWETKKDALEDGGSRAIEQISEALSTAAASQRLSEETLHSSLRNCYEQASFNDRDVIKDFLILFSWC